MLETASIRDAVATDRLQKLGLSLDGSYGRLPPRFYACVDPTPVAQPRLIKVNRQLAAELGLDLDGLDADTVAAIFSGNLIPPGSRPLAMAYAGHQFGQFVPQLGDGRAILLGDVRDGSGRHRDIQLKGSGRTPFSRSGDGRAALGPVLREYLVSEAMHALGIPATRALAAVSTGETVFRERPLPGAILTRVAAGHVRVGTFQYFAARADTDAVRRLAAYVIERHYPEIAGADNPHLDLLRSVVRRQASLVAGWMCVGFIHGVMNTDNMAVTGETIDFGPCAFMDTYDPATVFSSIDHRGRYAYANQPMAAQWNLARLAETLLPLIDPVSERAVQLATEVIGEFDGRFEEYWLSGMRRKLGLFTEAQDDLPLIRGLLDIMQRTAADFTVTFRRLSDAAEGRAAAGQAAENRAAERRAAEAGAADRESDLFDEPTFREWDAAWRSRLAREPQPPGGRAASMRLANPAFIPRNHRVEQVIAAAVEHADFAPFEDLCRVLSRPYEAVPAVAEYAQPPRSEERVVQTFCGT